MRFGMFLNGRGTSRTLSGRRPAKQAIRRAVRRALCEDLEKRQFLSVSSYTVPSGTTQVYLEKYVLNPSDHIDVHLGSPTAPVVAELDGSTTTSTDTITASDSGVTLYDEVPAVYKPSGGISFQSAADGALVIQAGDADTDISVPTSTSTGSTIQIADSTDSVTVDDTIGGDVTSLTIQTNSIAATSSAEGTTVDAEHLVSTVALTVNTEGGTYDSVTIGGYEDGVTTALVVTGAGHDSVLLGSDDDADSPGTTTVDFGAGTGSGDGTGLGNSLEVEGGRTAVLAQAPGSASHTVVVDSVVLDNASSDAEATLVVSDPSTIGTLTVGQADAAHINAASTINSMEVDSSAAAYVDAASTLGTMDVKSDGLCEISAASPITTLTVEGNVTYNESGSWLDRPSITNTNTIGSLTISSGVVNIGKQEVLVTGTAQSTLVGYIATAYDDYSSSLGGYQYDWKGSGITSSDAIANAGSDAIGYATSADHDTTGLTLGTGQVLLRTTIAGDATLDGTANYTDFLALQRGFGNPGDWAQGDFNYDGEVNFGDFLIFQANYPSTYTP